MQMQVQLRPYQLTIGRAVLDSVRHKRGLTFTVEVARQGGKNELSAQLELRLLTERLRSGAAAVKAAPTFDPQCHNSIRRLKARLMEAGLTGLWRSEQGHSILVGKARQSFFSAARDANVVGATADLLLEIDEAQDVDKDKYQKEFRPMASSTNATTVLYGTPWDNLTLLEEQKQINLDLEARDGIQRHFRYDWLAVAQYNRDYRAFVEAERDRLGEDHPLFKTQYALETIESGRNFLSAQQRAWLQGTHLRQHAPSPEKEVYVAGIDIAGEALPSYPEALEGLEGRGDSYIRQVQPSRDSTVVTIARVIRESARVEPHIEVLDHVWLTGTNLADLAPTLANLLHQTWPCRKIVVDATGMGAPIASMLTRLISSREIILFTFSAQSKSKLGFNLLAAVSANRLKLYQPDGSSEYQEFQTQLDHAQAKYQPNQTMNFFVDPRDGHDDFITSLALTVEAANLYEPRFARGRPAHGEPVEP